MPDGIREYVIINLYSLVTLKHYSLEDVRQKIGIDPKAAVKTLKFPELTIVENLKIPTDLRLPSLSKTAAPNLEGMDVSTLKLVDLRTGRPLDPDNQQNFERETDSEQHTSGHSR